MNLKVPITAPAIFQMESEPKVPNHLLDHTIEASSVQVCITLLHAVQAFTCTATYIQTTSLNQIGPVITTLVLECPQEIMQALEQMMFTQKLMEFYDVALSPTWECILYGPFRDSHLFERIFFVLTQLVSVLESPCLVRVPTTRASQRQLLLLESIQANPRTTLEIAIHEDIITI